MEHRSKAHDEWHIINDLIKDLWAPKVWSTALQQLWKDYLGNCYTDQVTTALRHFAAESTYFPKVGAVRKWISNEFKTHRAADEPDPLYDRQRHISHWITLKSIVFSHPYDALERHKRAEIDSNWQREWMADLPITATIWIAVLHHRIMSGCKPDDPTPDDVPLNRHKALREARQKQVDYDDDGYPDL